MWRNRVGGIEKTEKQIIKKKIRRNREMEMCYEGAMSLPSSYAVMNEEEMTYVEGGFSYTYSKNNIRARVQKSYLSRSVCLAFAEQVICEHGSKLFQTCNGMGLVRIASELFSHAVGYYSASLLKKAGLKNDVIKEIRAAGQYADIGLGDGMDLSYAIVWGFGGI